VVEKLTTGDANSAEQRNQTESDHLEYGILSEAKTASKTAR
jgi:hypothetical protein